MLVPEFKKQRMPDSVSQACSENSSQLICCLIVPISDNNASRSGLIVYTIKFIDMTISTGRSVDNAMLS